MKKHVLIVALSILGFLSPRPVLATEAELLSAIQNLQVQMRQMQGVIELQNQRLSQLEKREAAIQIAGAGQESSGQVMTEKEFGERLNKSLDGSNKWLKGLVFKGDTRLRYEAVDYHSGAAGHNPDRNRFRMRLRFGFEKMFSPELKTGFSLSSGEKVTTNGLNADPTSQNQTMNNDFNFKNIWIEKIFATYTPDWVKVGPIAGANLTAGKFDNPFERGSTDMIWSTTVKPEGPMKSST